MWLYTRARIRARYQDGELVDVKTGSAINEEDVRPVKTVPATKEVLRMIRLDDGALLLRHSDPDDMSQCVRITASRVPLIDISAEYDTPFWLIAHAPADPYGSGMPSARSVAHELISELNTRDHDFALMVMVNVYLGISCYRRGEEFIQEDSSSGKTIHQLNS